MKLHTGENMTDNVTRHPGHKKHQEKLNNNNTWTKPRLHRLDWQRSQRL